VFREVQDGLFDGRWIEACRRVSGSGIYIRLEIVWFTGQFFVLVCQRWGISVRW